MQTARSPKGDRLAALDLLRLAAALAVMFFHYFFRGAAAPVYLDQAYPEAAPFALYGYLGVNLFFLISGFVIAWSAENRTWRSFAVARFARLYPGFVFCMTATFLVQSLAGDARYPAGFDTYLANLFIFAPALGRPFMDGVYWSIALEIVFYGWVAVALFLGVFERWKLRLLAVWLLVAAANEMLVHSGALRLVLLTEYAPFFAAGVLAQHVAARGWSLGAGGLLAAAFLLSLKTLTVTQGWMLAHYGVAVPYPRLVGADIVVFALFACAISLGRRLPPSYAALALGGLTYPLYLLHENIGYIALNAVAGTLGRGCAVAVVTAAMILLSCAVWRLVETPLRRPLVSLLTPAIERLAATAAFARTVQSGRT